MYGFNYLHVCMRFSFFFLAEKSFPTIFCVHLYKKCLYFLERGRRNAVFASSPMKEPSEEKEKDSDETPEPLSKVCNVFMGNVEQQQQQLCI